MMFASNVFAMVYGSPGYCTDIALQPDELVLVRNLLKQRWLGLIDKYCPEKTDAFAGLGMDRYHELEKEIDHKSLSQKANRVLLPEDVLTLRKLSVFQQLERAFGEIELADEEGRGWPSCTWRVVRPHASGDVGPLHADAWFWDLGNGIMPPETVRVKVWIPIYCQTAFNGLLVVPDSHLRQWRYHAEFRDGYVKPQIDEDSGTLTPQLLATLPGQLVVFHDLLIHGGAVNQGNTTRVSLEFTLLISEANIRRRAKQVFGSDSLGPFAVRVFEGAGRQKAAA